MPPVIGYERTQTQLIQYYNYSDPSAIRALTGRFDYENNTDGLIILPNENPFWVTGDGENRIFVNKYDSNLKILVYGGIQEQYADSYSHINTEEGFVDIFCADINGDQKEQIIKINNVLEDNKDKLKIKIYDRNTYSGISLSKSYEYVLNDPFSTNTGKSVVPKFFYPGDFNGDGKIEVMCLTPEITYNNSKFASICHIFDLETGNIKFSDWIFSFKYEFLGDYNSQSDYESIQKNRDKLAVLDYDGDGKSDILHINNDGAYLYTFDNSGETLKSKSVFYNKYILLKDIYNRNISCGDMNCDGLCDVVLSPIYNGTNQNWGIYLSRGKDGFQGAGLILYCPIASPSGNFILRDINNDGRTEIIYYNGNSFRTFYFDQLLTKCTNSLNVNFVENNAMSLLVPIDVNSINSSVNLIGLNRGVMSKYKLSKDFSDETLLTGVVNSYKIVEKNEYRSLYNDKSGEDDTNRFYYIDKKSVYPYANFSGKIQAISNIKKYEKGRVTEFRDFRYKNAVIHQQGLGFCGFENVEFSNESNQIFTSIYDPCHRSVLIHEKTPYKESDYEYSIDIADNKKLSLNIVKETTTDFKTSCSSVVDAEYDLFGYPTSIKTTHSDGIIEEVKTQYSHMNLSPETSSSDLKHLLGRALMESKIISNGGYIAKKYGNGYGEDYL